MAQSSGPLPEVMGKEKYTYKYIYKKKMFCFEMSTFAFWIKTWRIVHFKTKIAHDDHKQNWWTITDTSSQSDL